MTYTYNATSRFFHWTIFVLLTLMLAFSYFMDDIPKDYKPFVFNTHKLTGLLILFLMVLRAIWAWFHPKPTSLNDIPWQRVVEKCVHLSLYVFVMAMPLAGWIGSVAAGRPPHLGDFMFNLPIEKNKALAEAAFEMHGIFAITIIVLVSLHIFAALYHHFIKKDDVLGRMLPNIRQR